LFCSLVKLDMQNVAVLWSDDGLTRTSVLNVLDFSWQHIQLFSSVEVSYRLGAAVLPKLNDHQISNMTGNSD